MKSHPSRHHCLELLETRIAPASLSGSVLNYKDLDGDAVTVKFTKGAPVSTEFTFDTAFASTGPQKLQLIDLHTDSTAAGSDITVTVKRAVGGDGLAAIGAINATGLDLGTVKIPGDLGKIKAGSNGAANVALKSLSVRSLGLYTTSNDSVLGGAVGSISILNDVQAASVQIVNSGTAANAVLKSLAIGGNVVAGSNFSAHVMGTVKIGHTVTDSTVISAEMGFGAVTIGGNLTNSAMVKSASGGFSGPAKVGGSILNGASLQAQLSFAAVTVGGDISAGGAIKSIGGGAGAVSIAGGLVSGGNVTVATTLKSLTISERVAFGAAIKAGTLGPVKLGADFRSSSIQAASMGTISIAQDMADGANITSTGFITSLTVGGSMANGGSVSAGRIISARIAGSLNGSQVITSFDLDSITIGHGVFNNAHITVDGLIHTAKISGGLNGSTVSGKSGIQSLTINGFANNSTIKADVGDITTLTVKSPSTTGLSISALGLINSVSIIGSVIDGLTINSTGQELGTVVLTGDVRNSFLTSAGDIAKVTINGSFRSSSIVAGATVGQDVKIGTVSVSGDWIASNLIAGVAANNNGYGNADDTLSASSSNIDSIVIKGIVAGTAGSGDAFGFEAETIVSLKIGGAAFALPLGAGTITLSPLAADVVLRQYA